MLRAPQTGNANCCLLPDLAKGAAGAEAPTHVPKAPKAKPKTLHAPEAAPISQKAPEATLAMPREQNVLKAVLKAPRVPQVSLMALPAAESKCAIKNFL